MQIKILTTPPASVNHQGLCIGLFSDERPPYGCAGLVDWRMNGLISREMKSRRITGFFCDNVLIDTSFRLPVAKVLLAGLGPLNEISCDRLFQGGRHMAQTMEGILCREYIVAVPSAARCRLAASGIAEAMIAGFFDFFSEKKGSASPAVCFRTEAGDGEESLAGFVNFQNRVNDDSDGEVFEIKVSHEVLEDF